MEDSSKWLADVYRMEEKALSRLVSLFGSPLRRFLQGMTGNSSDAEEMTQEVFERFLRKPREFSDPAQLKGYIFQIAHNLAVTKLTSASARREETVEELPERPSEETSTRRLVALEEKELVRELLSKLPPQQKRVVILRNWEEMTFREIGETLSLSEGTVKAHYFFALRRLKDEMASIKGIAEVEKGGRNVGE